MASPSLIRIITGLAGLASTALAAPLPLEFDLGSRHQLEVSEVGGSVFEFRTQGDDPYIFLKPFPQTSPAAENTVLTFECFCPEGIQNISVYYGPPVTAEASFDAGTVQRSESWLPFSVDLASRSYQDWTPKRNLIRLDFGRRPGVTFQIRGLQLRAPNAGERRSVEERERERTAKLSREERINSFYDHDFSSEIASVSVDRQTVTVRGNAASASQLLEIRPWVSLADDGVSWDGLPLLPAQDGIVPVPAETLDGEFELAIPRTDGTRDRTTSRWALAVPGQGGQKVWKLLSRWKYATDLDRASYQDLSRRLPLSVKGMGGVVAGAPLGELVELGIHNITVNIPLSGLLDTVPHEGRQPFEYLGKTWYVSPKLFERYDRVIGFATANNIVVSAILLVNFSDTPFGKLLVHPEAEKGGHFSIPNLRSEEGCDAYEAVVAFLSQRYATPGDTHGRISNWIIHNEINYAWEWTNMGLQPPMLYFDTYLRSMRLVHDVSRRDNPHSRVFISLTHHWNTPGSPGWKSYSTRDLVERLAASSAAEGDFAWGIAYHPYPENLREPDAWNDTRFTHDFDTPMILPINIGVLDRYMHQPPLLYRGKHVRGVLLSEQGFNTPDYSMESQRLQAAAFVYMWEKMRALESIEAFHNHRWIDAKLEGGLRLGIRTLASPGKPHGEKKFAWEIYRALGTAEEDEVTRFAEEVIGAPHPW